MAHTYADEKHLISRELFIEKMDEMIAKLEGGAKFFDTTVYFDGDAVAEQGGKGGEPK